MQTVRWGILGAGKIAAKFASAINFVEGAELHAVASRDVDKARDFASRYQTPAVYGDYESLVTDPDIDVIYIATPHGFHCQQAVICLENKKPVLSEKPMALNEGEVSRMAAAAARNGTFLMEGMWSRFMPAVNKVEQLIAQGEIGKVQYLRADFGFAAPFDATGRLYDLTLGGGSLLDVGVYPLFLTVLLLGEPLFIHSLGRLASTGADEYCNIIMQYEHGETASVFSSITTRTSLTAEIAGTQGRITMHNPWYRTTKITVELHDGETTHFSFPHEHNGFEYEIRHVMECLRQGLTESPMMSLSFSKILSRTMDRIRAQVGVRYSVD